MTANQTATASKPSRIFTLLKQSLQGGNHDFTKGSIRRAVLLLAIPMMLEMAMESVFALVDLYFVGHLPHSSYAIQTVGLTESLLSAACKNPGKLPLLAGAVEPLSKAGAMTKAAMPDTAGLGSVVGVSFLG